MGKRSNFERNPRDYYPTPRAAVEVLKNFIHVGSTFYEPCAGDGRLIDHLESMRYVCSGKSDITPLREDIMKLDAIDLTLEHVESADFIITNPPWDRKLLHPMVERFKSIRPTWLLFDADWPHTKQSSELMPFCRKIVPIGRVKWIEGSKQTGKDNACWYMFDSVPGITQFMGRTK